MQLEQAALRIEFLEQQLHNQLTTATAASQQQVDMLVQEHQLDVQVSFLSMSNASTCIPLPLLVFHC